MEVAMAADKMSVWTPLGSWWQAVPQAGSYLLVSQILLEHKYFWILLAGCVLMFLGLPPVARFIQNIWRSFTSRV
jgi:hypothetical protein